MNWIASVADEKIREAQLRGDFDNLPGKGKPLPPDDAAFVPDDLRGAFKMLKNAGLLPEEMQLRKDMLTLSDLLAVCRDEPERKRLQSELSAKKLRFRALASERGWHGLAAFADYEEQVARKLTESESDT